MAANGGFETSFLGRFFDAHSVPKDGFLFGILYTYTLPETNIAPENGWLEYNRKPYFQVLC